ncbi:MAG TPA: NAD(P)H-binding protein [Longimicrobium sp.]|nr:NAD(P)H-binding protein [Longimicrobium sp.]
MDTNEAGAPARILVTGATGNVGRHVVAELLKRGNAVRALVRDPAAARLPSRVDVVRGDLADPETLRPHLDGIESVFLLWPFFDADGIPALMDVLRPQSPRVVYLSAMGARRGDDGDEPFHHQVERVIEQSGVPWTFLRAGGFATNALWWAPQIRGTGVVRAPYPQAARSLIHERDIADVAVRALTDDRHAGARHELTGPAAVTQADQVRILSEVIRKPLRFEEIAPEAARDEMIAEGLPSEFAESSMRYWATLADHPEPVTKTVEEITRAPARPFRGWAMDHAHDFR